MAFPHQYAYNTNDNIAKLQEGTGYCLLGESDIRSWLHGDKNPIFCVGNVGSGKTVLASQVIDILQEWEHGENPVLYYFAETGTKEAKVQSSASILANFLKQLILHNQNISDQTRKSFERRINGGNRPTAEELLACFKRETMGTPKVFIVMDAVDQLADSCRQEVLGYLYQLQKSCPMFFMATSRPEPQPPQYFARIFRGYRYLGIRQTREDVEALLVWQMHRLPGVVMQDTGLQHYVNTEITRLSNGVYVLENTRRCITDMLRQVSRC